ncbi:MAG: DUF418 domain-containing protein [Bacteroidota bacterium]
MDFKYGNHNGIRGKFSSSVGYPYEDIGHKPVGNEERIDVLDALRGFAIIGILMINVRVFSGYAYANEEFNSNLMLTGWDHVFDWIHIVFFSGKFYSLFSLLFGIGFAIQLTRTSSAGRKFIPFFSRRLFFLLLIGIVHMWAIWFSDILVFYAICGYILILFRSLSNRQLWWVFFILLLFTGLHNLYLQSAEMPYTTLLIEWISQNWDILGLPEASNETYTLRMSDIAAVIRDGSWGNILKFNFIGPSLRAYFIAFDARIFKILATFVLGFWVGRKILFNSLHKNRLFLAKTALAGWIIGLSLNIFFMEEDINWNDSAITIVLREFLVAFSYISLASGYAASFVLLYESRLKPRLRRIFNSVGKTALTNYIFQSVLGLLLFYSAGLGLGEYFGSTLLTLAVFLIFLLQAILSNIWLKTYKYGPLEWLWRVLTYGRYIKNRQQ